MINIFCDSVVSVMTNCTTVEAVYTYGELVWNMGPSVWYVSWLPESLSGSFWMDRIPRNLEDYSGYYSWEGSGMITEGAFRSAGFTYMKTNVKLIENASSHSSGAFAGCRSLSVVDMPRCSMIGSYAFNGCYSLSVVNMSRCKYIGGNAFGHCSILESINLPRCSYIDSRAFWACSQLNSVYLPVCSYISNYAFWGCSRLTSIDLPMCSYIRSEVFGFCTSLSQVNLPVCEYVGNNAFAYCSSLTSIDLPMCSYIGNYAFNYCWSLSQVSLPVCEYVGNYAFGACSILTSINLPMCSYIGNYAFSPNVIDSAWNLLSYVSLPVCEYVDYGAFARCSRLTSIDLPMCSYIGNAVFTRCSSLSEVNLPVCGQIGSHAFDDCVSLSLLVLESDSVVSIDSSYHTFENTPFSICSGSILVPEELLNDYLTAPGWSSLSCVIYSIPITSYYINWTPTSLSGSFKMEGNTYNLEDYGGSFIWSNGVIDNRAFYSTGIQTMETTAFSIGFNAFQECHSLAQVSLPKCRYIDNVAFAGCWSLSQVSLPMCSYIGYDAFTYCTSLSVLTLGSNAVCFLGSSNAFNNTLIRPWEGSILVPASLVSDYQTATNWSYFADRIFSIPT